MNNIEKMKQKHHLAYTLKQDIWRFASFYKQNKSLSLKKYILDLWKSFVKMDFDLVQKTKTQNMLKSLDIL